MSKKKSLFDELVRSLGETPQTAPAEEVIEKAEIRVEGDIAENPIYEALNADVSDTEIIEKIRDLTARDPNLTKEENLAKIASFVAVNRHFQNQILDLAQRLADFTDDKALSLYDETIEGLQGRLKQFSGEIGPMVRALAVIKRAEEEGRDPMFLINEVQEMHKHQVSLREVIARQGYDASNPELGNVIKVFIDERTQDKEKASRKAEDSKTAVSDLEKKFFVWKKDQKLSDARYEARSDADTVTDLERQINKAVRALEKVAELTQINEKLGQDTDMHAISTLIHITGKEYSERREATVGNAKAFIEESIQQFNECIRRFENLEMEVQDFSNVADNVVQQYFLLIKGADAGYQVTEKILAADKAREEELEKQEEGQEIPSAERARLQATIQETKNFQNVFLPNSDSAILFRRTLAERQGEFTALQGLVQGKRLDAEELRTNGAVAVASQLVMTLKSLEAAVAGQKSDTLRSMYREFSSVARAATEDVLDRLVNEQGSRNERLLEALNDMVEMKQKLDAVTDDMLAHRRDEAGLTEAVIVATDRVSKAADDLEHTVSDGRREGKATVTPGVARSIVDKLEDKFAKVAKADDVVDEGKVSNDRNQGPSQPKREPGGMG